VTNSMPASAESERNRAGELEGILEERPQTRAVAGGNSTNVVRAGLGVVLVSPHSDEQPVASEEQILTYSQTTEEVAATRGESTQRMPSDG
jgi:hypothetical protein